MQYASTSFSKSEYAYESDFIEPQFYNDSVGGNANASALGEISGLAQTAYQYSDINLTEGSIKLTQMDLTLPGRNGMSVVIGREYNSKQYRQSPDLEFYQSLSWSDHRRVEGWFGSDMDGFGLDIADIDNNGHPDIVYFTIDNCVGENRGYYTIGWNLDENAKTDNWSGTYRVPGWFGAEDEPVGSIKLVDINNNGILDIVVFHVDRNEGKKRWFYRIGWDINSQGQVTSWRGPEFIEALSVYVPGLGVDFVDIDNNGTKDRISYYIEEIHGENRGYYKIGFDINQEGQPSRHSEWMSVDIDFPIRNGGGGVAVYDIDQNGKKDLIIGQFQRFSNGSPCAVSVGWDMDQFGAVSKWQENAFFNTNMLPVAMQGGDLCLVDLNQDGLMELFFGGLCSTGGADHASYQYATLHPEIRYKKAKQRPFGWGKYMGNGWSLSNALRAYVVHGPVEERRVILDGPSGQKVYRFDERMKQYMSDQPGDFSYFLGLFKQDDAGIYRVEALEYVTDTGQRYYFADKFFKENYTNIEDNLGYLEPYICGFQISVQEDLFNNKITYSYEDVTDYNVFQFKVIGSLIGSKYYE